jgi:hypothetical protein
MSDLNVLNFVIGAYAVAWVGLIGYTVRLFALNRRAKETVEELGGVE